MLRRLYYFGNLAAMGGGGSSDWLLSTGFWNDSGVWDDTATWID